MHVHARAVVTEQGLRHERGRASELLSGVLDDVLELQHIVGRLHHGVEAVVDLGLSAGSDLVVRALDLEPDLLGLDADLVTQIGMLVDRGHREVAGLVRRLVAEVAAFFAASAVPGAFDGVDLVERAVGLRLVPHVVEDVELGLRCEERSVGDTRGLEVSLGLVRDLTRVAIVDLAGAGVVDVEDDDKRLRHAEGVDVRRGHVGDELQVRLVDVCESADRRAVEQLPLSEEVIVCG